MDLLKREMERKRKALHEAKQKMMVEQSKSSGMEFRQRRFMKTSEVRRILEEEEEESKEKKRNNAANLIKNKVANDLDNESPVCNTKKQKLDHTADASNVSSNGDHTTPSVNEHDSSKDTNEFIKQERQSTQRKLQYTLEAVQRELRLLGLPVTYFGETSVGQRLQRLQHAQTHQSIMQLQEREADEFRLKQGFGIRNTFLEKDDANDGMQLAATELQKGNGHTNDHDRNSNSKKHNKTTDVGSNNKKNQEGHDHDNLATTSEVEDENDKHKRIYKHFKGLLKQWENDLNQRSDDVKRTLAGRNETKKVKQCKDYIRPLFQLCKRRQLDENMVEKLYAMVQFCEQGEFVRAHDAYMDIAIGRAAWPIGVTMVGIHARTGRAKIESSNVAHVMNSELQRKYLTSVKRLLTYEQNQRTDVDPSKKVR